MAPSMSFPCARGTFVKFPYDRWAFRQLFMRPRDHLSTSVCQRDLLSTFCTVEGLSVNYCQLSARSCERLSTLFAAAGPSVNFS